MQKMQGGNGSREIEFSLPIYCIIPRKTKADKKFLVALNWYRNSYPHENNTVKLRYLELIKPQVPKGVRFNKAKVSYKVYCKNTIDGGNVRSVIEKYFLDSIKDCGLIIDDNIKYIVGDDSLYFIDKENPRIEITVKEEK